MFANNMNNCRSQFKKYLDIITDGQPSPSLRNCRVSVFIVIEDNGPYLSISIHGIARQKTSALRTEVLWRPLHKGGRLGCGPERSGGTSSSLIQLLHSKCQTPGPPLLGHRRSG